MPNSGIFGANQARVISIKDARDVNTGAVVTPDVVPAGATAVTFNVTVAGTSGNNFVSIAPGDAAAVTASTINWSGPNLANGSVSKLDDNRQVKAFTGAGTPGALAHVIIDITGFFR
jgi:hypothetical protein